MLSSGILKETAILTVGVFLWFCLGSSLSWSGQDQENPLLKARQLIKEGDYEGAIKLLDDYIGKIRLIAEQKKNIAEAYYIIAKIYFIVGEQDDCDTNLKRAFEAYPALSIEESDLAFWSRVERARGVVLAKQKKQGEEKPVVKEKSPEKEQPVAIGKAGEAKKGKFPWLIAAGVAVAGGALAVLLLKKKSSAPQSGDIVITSNPTGAKVNLDGNDTGLRTDCTMKNISAGTHALKIELEYYGKWEGNVEVKGGQTANVNATLAGFQYEFVTKWGSLGSGDGQFNNPIGIAVDVYSYGPVYITDAFNRRVQKFDTSGTFQTKWGSLGGGDGQFNSGIGIAVDYYHNVYVTDTVDNRIQKFSSTGAFISKWGSSGSGDSQFNQPNGIAIDSAGNNVYVTDTYNHRIQKFSSTGAFISKWGSLGSSDGQFNRPSGIAADKSGVYIADTINFRLQKFTLDGAFVTKWGSEGNGDGQFKFLYGVALDGRGNVFVVDPALHRVQKFTSSGVFITKWGSQGSGDGQLNTPYGIAVDGWDFVYVADKGNHRIQKFQMTNQVGLSVTISYSPMNSSSKFYPFMNNLALKPQSQNGQLFNRLKLTPDPPRPENRQAPKIKDKEHR